MATLKDYAGVLSHHMKLVADSNIGPDRLHALHANGVFSVLLRCPKPEEVNLAELQDILMINDSRSIEELFGLCANNWSSVARGREQNTAAANWYLHMKVFGQALWAITRKNPQYGNATRWKVFSDNYHAEASARLLQEAYNQRCTLNDARERLAALMENTVPCSVCRWTGNHHGLRCGACNDTKQLTVLTAVCPECQGTGRGWAYGGTDGFGSCALCLNNLGGKIKVDSLNRPITTDPIQILGLPQVF